MRKRRACGIRSRQQDIPENRTSIISDCSNSLLEESQAALGIGSLAQAPELSKSTLQTQFACPSSAQSLF